jgi:hypothetical protein
VHVPVLGLDVQVVSLVGALDEVDAGEACKGLQTTLNDFQLPSGWQDTDGTRKTTVKKGLLYHETCYTIQLMASNTVGE